MDDDLPTPEVIIAIHDRLEEEYDMKYKGTRTSVPELKLRRALEKVAEEEGRYHRAGALLFEIQSVHVFEDGNKRTAWITVRNYLDQFGESPARTDELAEKFTRRAGKFSTEERAKFLKTGEVDEEKLN